MSPNPAKNKGDRVEREVCRRLNDQLGVNVTRMLGAGRKEDIGDAYGLPDTTLQITGNADATVAFRLKPVACELQQARAGTLFGATAVMLRGGHLRFVLTEDQFCVLWREAQPVPSNRTT